MSDHTNVTITKAGNAIQLVLDHEDIENIFLHDVLEQLVVPALLASGYSDLCIESYIKIPEDE